MNIRELLANTFGFPDFRPGQQPVVDSLLAGKSALAVFPTGSGKSLCYQLPALLLDGLTVVVCPLLSLMKDQVDQLQKRGIAAERLDSTLDRDRQRQIEDSVADGRVKILYVAPERLAGARFVERLRRTPIALLAVDEAHCISEWGHNFRPEYLRVADIANELGVQRVLALTATATPDVVADIQAAFGIEPEHTVVTGFARPNLILRSTPCQLDQRVTVLIDRLRNTPPGPTIVYVTLQKTAELVAESLRNAGFAADAYHAGMDDEKRSAVQDQWMRSPDRVVVATIAFGMGIDKADVRRVFHFNIPKSLESYSQEIGRAGRDGNDAWCEVLTNAADIPVLENFAAGDTPTRTALAGFLNHVFSQGDAFDIAPHTASTTFDIRLLVLRTLLTYLELDGILRLETRWFAKVEWRIEPDWSLRGIAESFGPQHGRTVTDLFTHAEKGRIWYKADPCAMAESLGIEQSRVMRMLEVMEERRMVETRTADQRLRYVRTADPGSIGELVDRMVARFEAREAAERARIDAVVALLELDSCRASALAAHFGQQGQLPCVRCDGCTGESAPIGAAPVLPAQDPALRREMAALAVAHPTAFGDFRQQARFLCGVSSPAAAKLRLGRKELYGALEQHPIPAVIAWLDDQSGPS
ncbi:MAG: RecQ family ATP-dependent DNA helicase [Armatimonadaceae bacterium]